MRQLSLPQMQQQLALSQLLHSGEAAAAVDVFGEVADAEDVIVEELRERGRIFLDFEPQLQVFLV